MFPLWILFIKSYSYKFKFTEVVTFLFFLLFYCQNSLIGDLFLMCFPCSVNKQEDLLPRTLICLRNKESFLIFMWEIMRVGHVIKFKIDCIGITFSLKSKNDSLLRIITIFFKHGEYHLNFWYIYITFIIKIRLCSNSVVYLAHTFIFLTNITTRQSSTTCCCWTYPYQVMCQFCNHWKKIRNLIYSSNAVKQWKI